MSEKIFNLYIFIMNECIVGLGSKEYVMSGSDEELLEHLKTNATSDASTARHYPIPPRYRSVWSGDALESMSSNLWAGVVMSGRQLDVFEEALQEMGAPVNPLYCLTPIEVEPAIGGEVNEEDVSERRTRHLEFIQANYLPLAAMAWNQHVEKGRGILFVRSAAAAGEPEGFYADETFLSGIAVYPDTTKMFNEYDPQKEMVIAIVDPIDGESSYRIGDPNMPPPMAAELQS